MSNPYLTARRHGRPALLSLAAGTLFVATGCNLDVLTPTVVPPSATEGAAALPTLQAGAVGDFAVAYGGYNNGNSGEGIVLNSGLFADEFISADYFSDHKEIDTRNLATTNASNTTVLLHLMQALRSAQFAADGYVAAGQADSVGHARVLNLAGMVYTIIAETYCSGVPFSALDASGAPVYGGSKSTTEVLDAAIARFDAAIAAARAARSATQLNVALVGKARALQDKGAYAAAAAVAAPVPSDFVFATEQGTVDERTKNGIFSLTYKSSRYTTADNEGVNGLLFVTQNDPRVPVEHLGLSKFDQSTELFAPAKYPSYEAPIPIATGVEARLIEAEAAFQGGSYPTALGLLNALRAASSLPDLDPVATRDEQVDQLFNERAFWLFGTAHRLGDLRRLVSRYQRSANSVFPTGIYFKGGVYSSQVNLRVPQREEQDNPQYNPGACDPTKA
jgi:hypothetical protein